jgi:proteic killer suppression protein
MIESFACESTRDLFIGERVERFVNIQSTALRKLQQLHAAQTLSFLRMPPGNRLEPLRGDLKGHYSIRINEQWRLCFIWSEGSAQQVQIIDYH